MYQELTQTFCDAGANALQTPATERKLPIEGSELREYFSSRELRFVVFASPSQAKNLVPWNRSVILTEGTDILSVNCVVIARPTRSQNIVTQTLRRADPSGSKVFIPNAEDDRKVAIKFTKAHNEKVHCLLTAKGLALPLRSCNRPTSGNSTMVVMNYVNGKQSFHKYPYVTPHEVLHTNDLVFGDLRSPSILIVDQHHV
ncbi:hypothetical protein BDM02DRAFT_3129920 [Thelephora ganbajun]|uniref:Uncharacterized protein n=1 Tax=Thelephora ganbajun TaxID=370292 RepID=A0ACB6ZD26_THEGA|nr:hypothetical protein BDM02DRAFT_3129920 [Thelephora ganbajun]